MLDLLFDSNPNDTAVGFAVFLGWLILGIIQLVLFIAALISILASRRYTGGGKFMWIVLVFLAPVLGAIGWFVAGRRAQIRTTEP